MSAATGKSGDFGDAAVWDEGTKSRWVELSEDKKTATRGVSKQTTDGVRTCAGYVDGRHLFRFSFNDKPFGSHCMLGLCSPSHKSLHAEGYGHVFSNDDFSWGWDVPTRVFRHSNKPFGQLFRDVDNLPRVFYMLVDLETGKLGLGLDPFDIRFCDFGDRLCASDGMSLYPAVSLVYGRLSVRIDDVTHMLERPVSPLQNVNELANEVTDIPQEKSDDDQTNSDLEPMTTASVEGSGEAARRLQLKLLHAWHQELKNESVCLYPGMPNVCYLTQPSGTKHAKVVHSRFTLTKGKTSFRLYVKTQRSESSNSQQIFFGIADEEHAKLEYDTLSDKHWPGSSMQLIDFHSKQFWNGKKWQPLRIVNADLKSIELHIDMTKNVWSCSSSPNTLLKIPYKSVRLVALLQRHFRHYVELDYVGSTDKHYESRLLAQFPALQPSLTYRQTLPVRTLRRAKHPSSFFCWEHTSSKISLTDGGITAQLRADTNGPEAHQLVIGKPAISFGRHVFDVTIAKATQLSIGFVSESFPRSQISNQTMRSPTLYSVLGAGDDSWGWEVYSRKLQVSGIDLGYYPPRDTDSLSEDFKVRLSVDFEQSDNGRVQFSSVNSVGDVRNLGIAFNRIDEMIFPAVAFLNCKAGASARLDYIAGPAEFIEFAESFPQKSCLCTIV